MADVMTSVRNILLASSTVTNLVATRIIPDVLEQGETLPAITYRRISTRHEGTITGTDAGMAQTRITFDCFASTRLQSDAVAEAIRTSGIRAARGTYTDVFIHDVAIDDGVSHTFDPPEDGSDDFRYVASVDYLITYQES